MNKDAEKTSVSLEDWTDDALAERRAEIRGEVSIIARKNETLAAERDDIDQEFKRRFKVRETSGTKCSIYTISLRRMDNYPQVIDRGALEEFILESGKLHLLQNRVAQKAMQEELAVMTEEVAVLKERLADVYDYDLDSVALDTLLWIDGDSCDTDSETMRLRLNILKASCSNLRKKLGKMLDDALMIPGVEMITKESITQIKRS